MTSRVVVVACVGLASLGFLTAALGRGRVDRVGTLLLTLLAVIAVEALHPGLGNSGYDDYSYFLSAKGVRPFSEQRVAVPLYRWVIDGGASFDDVARLNGWLVAALVPLTYLSGVVLALSERLAFVAAGGALLSASVLVYGPGVDGMALLALGTTAAFILAEAAMRRGVGTAAVAAALSGLISGIALRTKPEGMLFVAGVPLVFVLRERATPAVLRVVALALWPSAFLIGNASMPPALPFGVLVSRAFVAAPRRLADEGSFVPLVVAVFAATNGLGAWLVAAARRLWLGRFWPRAWVAIPLTLACATYAWADDAARHQLVALPFALPAGVAGLAFLYPVRPRTARALGCVGAFLFVGTCAGFAARASLDERRAEWAALRRVPSQSVVRHLPYPARRENPAAPLLALVGSRARVETLVPPEGCPPQLFEGLARLLEDCMESTEHVAACRSVLSRTSGDWVDQAAALAALGLDLPGRELARWSSPEPQRAVPVPTNEGDAEFMFRPFWRVPRPSWFWVAVDMNVTPLPEFAWLDAADLALDVERGSEGTLVPARLRSSDDAKARCMAIAARASGRALFDAIEPAASLR